MRVSESMVAKKNVRVFFFIATIDFEKNMQIFIYFTYDLELNFKKVECNWQL